MSKYDKTKGVKFGNIHSYKNLGALLKHKEISEATPQTVMIQIPGRDGKDDLTAQVYGTMPRFEGRTLLVELRFVDTEEDAISIYSNVNNLLNGKNMNIVFDDDPAYHWEGKVFVGQMYDNGIYMDIPITAEVYPYKLCDDSFGSEDWLWDELDFVTGEILQFKWTIADKEIITISNPYYPTMINMSANPSATVRFTDAYGATASYELDRNGMDLGEFQTGVTKMTVTGSCDLYIGYYVERKSL